MAGRMVAGGLVLALAPVAGLAALAGMALVGAGPEVFTVVGLAVFASVLFLGLLLCVPRPHVAWGRWSRAVLVLGVEAAAVWQVSALTLNPLAVPPAPAGVAGQREWRLPTGSRLAYVRIAPERVTRPEPVVFLHGGPGVGDLEGDSAFYGRLASAGFEVYVYDQLGAGRSARLADPRGYGLARDVADLEAIRRTVRAGRLNLVARDYGAQLAAAYLAAHPGQVARAVLYSPTGLTPARAPSRIATSAIPLGPGALPHPRTLAVSALLRVDPATARAFAGDRELDAHLALLLRNQARPRVPRPRARPRPRWIRRPGRADHARLPQERPGADGRARADRQGRLRRRALVGRHRLPPHPPGHPPRLRRQRRPTRPHRRLPRRPAHVPHRRRTPTPTRPRSHPPATAAPRNARPPATCGPS
ncbi:hypothetical protein GCM10020220_017670 [Nonomuraea rubra]|uniref:alpha/beta fold hydrolase n=1 Tax=Nonomuraea rubra TaxID=46180 RepID=UPI0031ED02D2